MQLPLRFLLTSFHALTRVTVLHKLLKVFVNTRPVKDLFCFVLGAHYPIMPSIRRRVHGLNAILPQVPNLWNTQLLFRSAEHSLLIPRHTLQFQLASCQMQHRLIAFPQSLSQIVHMVTPNSVPHTLRTASKRLKRRRCCAPSHSKRQTLCSILKSTTSFRRVNINPP
jgi:hypothetical protein